MVFLSNLDKNVVMSNRLREIRKAKGLSQERLAALADTTAGQISKLESKGDTLNINWMRRLAIPLNIKPSDLLIDDDVSVRLNNNEQVLLNTFQSLNRIGQQRLLNVASAMAMPIDLPSAETA